MAEADLALPVPDDLHPNAGVRVRRRRRLQLVASQQRGCFTVADTTWAGYDRRARHHHLSYGNWRRTDAPGVYRLTGWPIDPAEPYQAWLLWAGAGAELTSWSALGVQGVLEHFDAGPPDPAIPVHVVVQPVRRARRRDRELRPDATLVRIHSPTEPMLPGRTVNGLAVRPIEEALCVALRTSSGSVADQAAALTDQLLDDGTVDFHTLLDVARACRATRMLDLLWPRLRPPRTAAG